MRIGIDIGGSKIEAVAVDESLVVRGHFRAPVQRGPGGVLTGALEAISELGGKSAESIGVGIPGAVRGSVVEQAQNLDIESLDLGSLLSGTVGVPVRIGNDVNAAALGAWAVRAEPTASLAYLNLGTGLAAGLVLRGSLWEGMGAAGEIGYISIDPAGPAHIPGLPGTLESYASGIGVTQQWGVPGASSLDVFTAAQAGDPKALAIQERVYFGAAHAVRVLALAYGTDAIVLGGGLTGLGAPLLDGIRRHFETWEAASPFLASLRLGQITSLLDDPRPVPAIGAALLAGQPSTVPAAAFS